MTTLVPKARGRPFKPGNPGRPPGSRNKTTQMVEKLAQGQAEQLLQKALELAQGGDVTCLRMMLDRLWPVRKGQPVNVAMPPINTPQDVLSAIASIWAEILRAALLPMKQARCLLSSIARYRRSSFMTLQSASQRSKKHETNDMVNKMILRRLEALEKLNRPPGTIVSMGTIDYNKLFNLEGEKAKPENIIKYLGKIDEDGICQCIGSVIANSSDDPTSASALSAICTGSEKEKPCA